MKLLLPFCACLLAACGEKHEQIEDILKDVHTVQPCFHGTLLFGSKAEADEFSRFQSMVCRHQEVRCLSDGHCEIVAVWP